ncbi:MAG: hypothetical protein PWP60_618 [Candidatus Atribacteria bacterium]|jgi:outer membrane lipoprotein-sorting protein|nr:hypothetical protein [Candidatus Atribacteria bacterium]
MRKYWLWIGTFVLAWVLFGGIVWALTADEILDEVEKRRTDFVTQRSEAKMILVDENGKEEVREVVMYSKDEGDDTISLIVRFLSPADVEGVTLLSIKGGEKIYLYMPAYRKVRRIAGSGKKEKFMGTDFSYDDLSQSYGREDYEATLLREDEENYYLELRPFEEDSDYSKLVMTVDKEKFYFKKIEFYDLEGNLWKELQVLEIEEDEEGKITILKMSFKDLKENHETRIETVKHEEDIPLPDNFFSVRTIQRPEL